MQPLPSPRPPRGSSHGWDSKPHLFFWGQMMPSCSLVLQVSLNPIRVMTREADEEKAEVARLSSFVGAMAIGDLVKSTLGPKGMDKLLLGMGRNEGQVEVTNDGATILKAVGVDNPAAKILVNMSRVQDDEVGWSVIPFSQNSSLLNPCLAYPQGRRWDYVSDGSGI